MAKNQNQYFSKIIDKGIRILSLFNPECISLSLKEISRKTGINSTSTYRFVDTYIQLGYLKKDSRTKLIKLGPKVLTLAYNFIRSFDLRQIVAPILDEVYDTYNISIESAVLEGDTLLTIYQRSAKDTLTFHLPSVVSEIHCTALGKAILAYLPENEMREIIDRMDLVARTKKSLSDKDALKADLKKTKERGYSLTDEEFIPGYISISTPFNNIHNDRPVGAIAFDFPKIGHSLQSIESEYARIIIDLAKKISTVVSVD